jgi:drug/metabolite transporter superfamily protein YnfA
MSYTIKGQIRQTGIIKSINSESAPPPPPEFTNTLSFTLNNPAPVAGDLFGMRVALSGDRAIVGASYNDTGATSAGSAYIYDVTTGALLHTLNNPTLSEFEYFGWSVDIDDNRAIVGAVFGNSAGTAYIYDVTTGNLLHTLNNPSPAAGDRFAESVAISGNRAIVGARADDTGATDAGSVYIYDVTTGNLLRTINNPTPQTTDWFGVSVAIEGNSAIVGAALNDPGATDAGSAYIYDVTTGALLHTLNNPTPQTTDWFGGSVAISGNTAIVGAYSDNTGGTDAGSAYIYDVTTGNLLHTINNPTPEANDQFGGSVAISGNTAIIGNGNGVFIGAGGDNTGATDAGSAYIYDVTTGNLLHTINNPTPQASDQFGISVAIDEINVIIGARNNSIGPISAGSAYLYK